MSTSPWRLGAVLIAFATVVAGCGTYGQGVYRSAERVIVRPAPVPASTSRAVYNRTNRDARNYTVQMSRSVPLSRAQQQAIHHRLTDRTLHLLDRTQPRHHSRVYPFPRRANERDRNVTRFWRDADRDIERMLNRDQRRVYRDFVRHRYEDRSVRNNRHPHGGPPGRRR